MNWWRFVVGIVLLVIAIGLYRYLFKVPFKDVNRDYFSKNLSKHISQETMDWVNDFDEWTGKIMLILVALFGILMTCNEVFNWFEW